MKQPFDTDNFNTADCTIDNVLCRILFFGQRQAGGKLIITLSKLLGKNVTNCNFKFYMK